MTVFNITSTLRKMESYLAASGWFKKVQIGEPKSAPGENLTASIFMNRVSVAGLTLNGTIESHVVTLRIYRDMLAEPQEQIETDLAQVVQLLAEDFLGDFDLGATVRNVDAAGQYGTPLSTTYGYVDIGGKMYRVADVTVPLVVDDSAALTA